MIILRVWIGVYCAWAFHFYNFFSFCLFPTDLQKFQKKCFCQKTLYFTTKIFCFDENFQKSLNFVIFVFFHKICCNSCKVYLKHTPKIFLNFFWPFPTIIWGSKHNCHFAFFCFQALVNFGENFQKSSNFVIFVFFQNICFNLCKVYLKHAPKCFLKFFGYFWQ